MIKAVRGTRDLLPPETALWNFVEAAVRDVFRAYNFQEIRTPIFESTELFARGVGEETDVVAKEMYTWEDRGRAQSDKGQSLTLRPENTAERRARLHRAQAMGTRAAEALLHRPAVSPGAAAEGTLPPVLPNRSGGHRADQRRQRIACARCRSAGTSWRLCSIGLAFKDWTLELNSVGCTNDRAAYNEALRKALEPVVSSMCVDCQRRAVTNPLRVFDCKVPEDQPIIEKLPRISQFLDEGCRKHFEQVQAILNAVGVPFTLNDRLVRGLDYYTRTAFEFTHGALGCAERYSRRRPL